MGAITSEINLGQRQRLAEFLGQAESYFRETAIPGVKINDVVRIKRRVRERLENLSDVLSSPQSEVAFKGAVFNQILAADFLHLMQLQRNGQTDKRVLGTRCLAAIMERINDGKVTNILRGARAQAGVMFCLENNGYFVIAPQTDDEVKVMDLHSVDFAAISQDGKIYLIDAKSDFDGEEVKVISRDYPSIGKFLNIALKRLSTVAGGNSIRFPTREDKIGLQYAILDVILPTNKEFIDHYGRLVPESIKKLLKKLSLVSMKSWT